MLLSLLGITAFLVYWLVENYKREEKTLQLKTEMLFREEMMKLQVAKFKLDRQVTDSGQKGKMRVYIRDNHRGIAIPGEGREQVISSINVIRDKMADSIEHQMGKRKKAMLISMQTASTIAGETDSVKIEMNMPPPPGERDQVFSFLYGVDSLQDSIRITEIDSAYRLALKREKLQLAFTIHKTEKALPGRKRNFGGVTIGIAKPLTYSVSIDNAWPYLMRRIAQPVIFAVLLLFITILAFWVLNKNLRKHRKLAELKNEFISNITHELKTPIATVGVAIEALKNFNAMDDPARTREYLDISQHELNRLSLLVDKVLKLSMFESQGIELKYEMVNLRGLVTEVLESLKLQLDKFHIKTDVQYEGETELQGDRLHLLSVIFNLVDNAIKYRGEQNPSIWIKLNGDASTIRLTVTDNGIGIPEEYQGKVFDKFFRVPHGDTHNAKGYGLGLSYVSQVVQKHQGAISVEQAEGGGSCFSISLPKRNV